jgi:uncharacterized lipoprotein YmbA
MNRILFLIFAAFLAGACSIPETKMYSLYIPIDQKNTETGNTTSVSLSVTSPKYLDQPYIAYRKNLYELDISRYSKWEASPSEMVGNLLRETLLAGGIFHEVIISHALQDGLYNLEIDLKQFERYEEKDLTYGVFAMNIVLRDPSGKTLFTEKISRKIVLDEKSFLSLARNLSITLSEELEKIQNRIRKAVEK